jgi:hypothetical protein
MYTSSQILLEKAEAKTNGYQNGGAPYEDGTLGLYNVIVPRGGDYNDKIARNERLKLEKLRDSVERVIGPLSPDSFIAGGALTALISGEPVNDIDVFGTASNRLQSILSAIGYTPTFENTFIANYNIPELEFCTKLQIIKTPISLEDYFKQLDNTANGITIGSRAASHVLDSLIYDSSAITLARKKIIRINNYAYPAQNLSRMLKYIARGWKIEVDSLKNVAIQSGKYLNGKPATLETFSLVGVKGDKI